MTSYMRSSTQRLLTLNRALSQKRNNVWETMEPIKISTTEKTLFISWENQYIMVILTPLIYTASFHALHRYSRPTPRVVVGWSDLGRISGAAGRGGAGPGGPARVLHF